MGIKDRKLLGSDKPIVKSRFSPIRDYTDVTLWQKLSLEERNALGLAFVRQGTRMLKRKSPSAYHYFALAENVAFFSKEVWLEEGKAWLQYGRKKNNEQALYKAEEKLQKSLGLKWVSFEEVLELGKIFLSLGTSARKEEYFQKAHTWFSRAKSLCGNKKKEQSALFFNWALCWEENFYLSEEPSDLRQALLYYDKTYKLSCRHTAFFERYINSLLRMADCVKSIDYLRRALEIFRENHLLFSKEDYLQILHAKVLARLYLLEGEELLFYQAKKILEPFCDRGEKAAMLRLAHMYLRSGIYKEDVKRLFLSLQVLYKAEKLFPACHYVHQLSAEVLAALGAATEQLTLLKEGEEAANKSIALASEDPVSWFVLSKIFLEQARYFDDKSLLKKSLTSLQKGLSIDKKEPKLWLGLALTLFTLGEWEQDAHLMAKAVHYAQVALEKKPHDPFFWSRLGWLSLKKSEYTHTKEDVELAVSSLQQAISLRGGVSGTAEIEWLYHYGCALDFLGDFTEKEDHYQEAIKVLSYAMRLDPEDLSIRYNLGLALSHLGESQAEESPFFQATAQFQFLIAQDPQDELALNDWGVALLNLASLSNALGKEEKERAFLLEAKEKLEQAAELGNGHAFYHLACWYSLEGRSEEALDCLYKAESHGGLPPLSEIYKDDWLEPLRDLEGFKRFVESVVKKSGYQKGP